MVHQQVASDRNSTIATRCDRQIRALFQEHSDFLAQFIFGLGNQKDLIGQMMIFQELLNFGAGMDARALTRLFIIKNDRRTVSAHFLPAP